MITALVCFGRIEESGKEQTALSAIPKALSRDLRVVRDESSERLSVGVVRSPASKRIDLPSSRLA